MSSPVFLDRDGVINMNRVDYVKAVDEWVPLPGAISSVVRLSRAGHPVVVVTNQSSIGRDLCSEAEVRAVNRYMISLVEEAGGTVAGVYYCPHHPESGCSCRKPETGMVDTARKELALPPGGYMVGDADSDMELGRRTGLRTILVLTGRGREQLRALRSRDSSPPWRVAFDLPAAVDIILRESGGGSGEIAP